MGGIFPRRFSGSSPARNLEVAGGHADRLGSRKNFNRLKLLKQILVPVVPHKAVAEVSE